MNKFTLILKFASDRDLNAMKEEIDGWSMQRLRLKKRQLDLTIHIFDVGDTEGSKIRELIEDSHSGKHVRSYKKT